MISAHPALIFWSWFFYMGAALLLAFVFKNALFLYIRQLVRPQANDRLVWEDIAQHRRKAMLLALLAALVSALMMQLPLTWSFGLFVALALVLPKVLMARAHKAMLMAFDDSLCDGLMSLASSLRAGLTIQSALGVASKSTAAVFAAQTDKVLIDYRLGLHIDEALARVRQRVPTPSCNMAIGALIIGKQLGGPLPDILERIADTIRERRRVEGRLRTLTAQGRGQAVLVCSMPIFVVMGTAWLTPDRMRLITSTTYGQILLAAVGALVVIGALWSWRLLQLDV